MGKGHDDQGLTGWTKIYNLNTSLIYEVYLRGEILQKIAVKAYPDKKTRSIFKIKVTSEITKNVKENIKEIYLNDGEVAWYLIKKTEIMHDWAKRVFKKPLIASDWDTLKAALDIYNAGDAIANAKPEEKTRTTVVESSKIVGGITGAAIGGFIVVTVASGGTSLIVLGVATGASALLGWGFGEGAGWIASEGYDFINR